MRFLMITMLTLTSLVVTAEENSFCEYERTNMMYSKVSKLSDQARKNKYYCFLALNGDHRAQSKVSDFYADNDDLVKAYGWIMLSNSVAARKSKQKKLELIKQSMEASNVSEAERYHQFLSENILTGVVFNDSGKRLLRSNIRKTGTKMIDTKPIGNLDSDG